MVPERSGGPGPAAIKTAKGELTRTAILDAAIERFGRDGYRATSVADIARDAGVGGTVAYAYFPSKEALFLAAADQDAAGLIEEGMSTVLAEHAHPTDWRESLIFTLVGAVDHHPLARRLLSGLEPGVTDRVLEIPALAELRKAVTERIRTEQATGRVRPDIDAATIANGIVSINLSLLMSVTQIGSSAAIAYGPDIAAVFAATLDPVTKPR